ncbi:MAG TPA: YbaB/EbfC family nucleoid-associated protein [Rickettsiales bacterium]|nr:YbaB/EbfC family nucleoid-associated protein [Rickettsiales bacterium]
MDMKSIMKQAQEMQKKMQKMQEELAETEYEGVSGGGMVKAIITGAGIAKKIEIDNSLINKDEKDILEDLLIAAFNDAKKKADDGSENMMKSVTGNLPLPKGFF